MDLDRIEASFTSRKWQWFITSAAEGPSRLVQFLIAKLPHIEPDTWAERMAIGGVYVNGLEAGADCELPVPAKVEYYEPKVPLADLPSEFAPSSACRIVYEDDFFAVVWKPRRLSCMPGKEQKTLNLKSYLEKHYGTAIHMPSRLDMSTQGLVAVSRHRRSHDLLQRLFEERRMAKKYLALLSKKPDWLFKYVSGAIGQDPRHSVLRMAGVPDGRPAETIFRRVPGSSLAAARPLTGRTHQIRVHSSHIGHPIKGDNFYGGATADELHLVSYALQFRHPVTGEYCSIEAPANLLPGWINSDDLLRLKRAEIL